MPKCKVPKSVYEEIKNLKERIGHYALWKKEDEEKIRALKELWKIE